MAKAKPKLKSKVKTKTKTKTKPRVSPKAKPKLKVKTKAKPKAKPKAKVPNKTTTVAKRQVSAELAPLQDRLVVRILSQEKKTAGGLYIPETSQMSGHLEGQVLSIGPGKTDKKGRRRPTDVKVGDRVLFSEYAGVKTELGGNEVRILSETEVLGILDK